MGSRIDAAMKNANLSQTDLAGLMNVSPQAVQQWVSGETNPRGKRVAALASVLKVDASWLLTGVSSQDSPETNAEPAPELGRSSRVPVVGSAQLGDNGHWTEMEYPVGHGDGFIEYPTRDRNAYAIRCKGAIS